MSELDLNVKLDTQSFESAFKRAPRQVTAAGRRALETMGDKVCLDGKTILIAKQNRRLPNAIPSGSLAGGIHRTVPQITSEGMNIKIQWSHGYGPIVEFGAKVSQWLIRAKFARALRFGWPMAPTGGFTALGTGKFKVVGGKRHQVMQLREELFYFKKVLHRYLPSHRREHIKPAIDQNKAMLTSLAARIPIEAIR